MRAVGPCVPPLWQPPRGPATGGARRPGEQAGSLRYNGPGGGGGVGLRRGARSGEQVLPRRPATCSPRVSCIKCFLVRRASGSCVRCHVCFVTVLRCNKLRAQRKAALRVAKLTAAASAAVEGLTWRQTMAQWVLQWCVGRAAEAPRPHLRETNLNPQKSRQAAQPRPPPPKKKQQLTFTKIKAP